MDENDTKSLPNAQQDQQRKVDPAQLASLYPHAKTYDELRQDETTREELRRDKLPKRPYVSIALGGSLFSTIVLMLLQNTFGMWASGNIGVIFFSFAFWLGALFIAVQWINHTNDLFYKFGMSSAVFWLGYAVLMSAYIATRAVGWLPPLYAVGIAVFWFGVIGWYAHRLFKLGRKR